jgi:putative ABC transport system substrate-binding protein
MDRRAFLGTLTGALLAESLAAEAQPAGKVFRIGILANLRPSPAEPGGGLWQAFIEGLQELGYVESRNITIEWRVSEGKYERLPDLAADLVRRKVDVIVVPADQNALAARHVTRTIPIVVASSADPVGGGLVASLARPGGNITGLSAVAGPEIVGKQLQLLKAIAPEVSRIGILLNPGNPFHAVWLREARIVAQSLTVQVQALEAREPDDLAIAFAAITAQRAGAVLVLGDGMFILQQKRIADFVSKSRLPTIGSRDIVNTVGLLSYGASGPELFRRAATYVDKILKGAKPADLPMQQPTKYELVINLKTAKALGITIPGSVLQLADEVIQ